METHLNEKESFKPDLEKKSNLERMEAGDCFSLSDKLAGKNAGDDNLNGDRSVTARRPTIGHNTGARQDMTSPLMATNHDHTIV